MAYHRGPCGGGTSKETNPLMQKVLPPSSILSTYWNGKHVGECQRKPTYKVLGCQQILWLNFSQHSKQSSPEKKLLILVCMCKESEGTNDNKFPTCSGDREKVLFPIVNEMSGRLPMLLQSINGIPNGFGSFSHTFSTKKKRERERRFQVRFWMMTEKLKIESLERSSPHLQIWTLYPLSFFV